MKQNSLNSIEQSLDLSFKMYEENAKKYAEATLNNEILDVFAFSKDLYNFQTLFQNNISEITGLQFDGDIDKQKHIIDKYFPLFTAHITNLFHKTYENFRLRNNLKDNY